MTASLDLTLKSLFANTASDGDRDLAERFSPIIRFDEKEPFYPLAAGYTVFRQSAESPSFLQGKKIILEDPKGNSACFAVEYAIWWDWDIGHLYELEHIWVYVGEGDRIVRVEASWHGESKEIPTSKENSFMGTHPVLLSEPGKHAFAPTPAWFFERRKKFKRSETSELAGVSGVLPSKFLSGKVQYSPLNHRLAHTYLSRYSFEPSWNFIKEFRFAKNTIIPWHYLLEWIPDRVNAWLEHLRNEIQPFQYRFLRIGHRGASAYKPDNTLASFRHAARLGADMVELDVQRTRDGQAAVIHDLFLRADGNWILPVKDSTLEELRKVDLGEGERVPLLREALEVCKEENLGAYIEIKDGAVIPLVISTLKELKYGGFCILGSFRPDWLLEIKRIEPRLATSVLFSSIAYDGVKAVQLARSCMANFVHPCWDSHPRPYELLTPQWMDEVRNAGLGVILWHEERPEVIAELRKAGVDGICSDKPELLLLEN